MTTPDRLDVLAAAALRAIANEAARAVTEPRRFHENQDNRQQALSHAVAEARRIADEIDQSRRSLVADNKALREAAEAAERDCRKFIEGTFDKVDEIMARQSLDALRAALDREDGA